MRMSCALPIAWRLTDFMLAAITPAALAQTAVTGRITDPQGKAVVGAAVQLAASHHSAIAAARTDGAGQYWFRGIAHGEYQVTASASAFSAISKAVSLTQGQTAVADI